MLWLQDKPSARACWQTTQSLLVQHLCDTAASAQQLLLGLAPIPAPLSCSTCVGLTSVAAERLANPFCYLILPADTSIHLPGSLFSLSSQLLPAPFWCRWSFAQLHESRRGSDPNLLSVPLCVHCPCWNLLSLIPLPLGFGGKGLNPVDF